MAYERREAAWGVVRCNDMCLCCNPADFPLTGPDRTLYDHDVPTQSPGRIEMALPKRSAPSSFVVSEDQKFCDPEFKAQYPSLFAFLNDTSYSDGSRRLTGTLSLFVKAGRLTCGVNDNDRLICAYVNAVTVAELLFLVDEGIAADSLEWKQKYKDMGNQKPPF